MAANPSLDSSRDAPARLGRYELIGHLATGGMAEIHLARLAGEGGFEKSVVVKRLLPELVASPAYVAMFLDEGKLVARLDHPNICEVYDLGRDGAEYYLAMPYLDGIPVHDLIARPRESDRAAQLRVAVGVIAQACDGLHHAHELSGADLVHRDVSPSNLFVTASGVVKVLDFGIAKVRGGAATEAGMIKGKTQYMAPEQLLGDAVDRRCDVFALGIVLFELATHQRLFKRASDYLAAKAILEDDIPRADAVDPAVPAALADVIAKALARKPEDRYATAKELGVALAAMHPASPSEIAAQIAQTDELSAQRTRQQRVLGEAKSKLSEVATRPFVAAIEDVTEVAPRRRFRATWWLALLAIIVAGVVVIAVSRRGEPQDPVALDMPPNDPPRIELTTPLPRKTPEVIGRSKPIVDKPEPRLPPPTPFGVFSIDSTPYATIYLDGVRLGITPMVKRKAMAGRRTLRAVLANGRSKELTIQVPPNGQAKPIQLTW